MSTQEKAIERENKTVNRSTYFLSIALTFFVTLVVTAVSMYFITINMRQDARASVVQDMQVISKNVK